MQRHFKIYSQKNRDTVCDKKHLAMIASNVTILK